MKNKVKKESQIRKERNKGITLIALVVTIIVLIILAVISINLVFNEGGIISKSERARDFQVNAEASDREALDALAEEVDKYDPNAPQKPVKVTLGEITEKNGTINGEAANWNNPIVPEGYKAINTGTSNWGDGSSNPTEANVNKGLVIEDRNQNQWVWVPVKDVSVMCDTANATEYTLCGTSGDTAVKTKLYSKSEIISGKTRTTPGTTSGYRESDLVVGDDGTKYDAANYKKILGESGTKEDLAQLFVKEYKEMIESVGQYKGFYIGRYELTANGEKPGATLTNTTWYNLYNKCKEFGANDKVKSRMIWGCQWDVTCKWLDDNGYSMTDSRSWGNYSDSTDNAKVVIDGENKYGSQQDTGFSEYWKANNIYDFAGNCYEWTQEVGGTSGRASRGGGFLSNGSYSPASDRDLSYGAPTNGILSGVRLSPHFNSSRES